MERPKIKCLVWDLDNTLWHGTLLEGGGGGGGDKLREGVRETIEELDRRGILLSIASKNEHDDAIKALKALGIEEYFLVPQINWGNKSESIAEIARLLNLGLDTFAFIDDQEFERAEVNYAYPEIRTYDAEDVQILTGLEDFTPRFITKDSGNRRKMYLEDLTRNEYEKEFTGSDSEFLKTLNMKLTIAPVAEGDLERVEELTLRTNQLNSTGISFSYDELKEYINSPDHIFLIAELQDKFGDYGKIGLVLCEKTENALTIKLLLMSCRVMTRGIGSALLVHITKLAQEEGRELFADFISTPRNRIMYITYKLMGFEEVEENESEEQVRLKYNGEQKEYPDYLLFQIRKK